MCNQRTTILKFWIMLKDRSLRDKSWTRTSARFILKRRRRRVIVLKVQHRFVSRSKMSGDESVTSSNENSVKNFSTKTLTISGGICSCNCDSSNINIRDRTDRGVKCFKPSKNIGRQLVLVLLFFVLSAWISCCVADPGLSDLINHDHRTCSHRPPKPDEVKLSIIIYLNIQYTIVSILYYLG